MRQTAMETFTWWNKGKSFFGWKGTFNRKKMKKTWLSNKTLCMIFTICTI